MAQVKWGVGQAEGAEHPSRAVGLHDAGRFLTEQHQVAVVRRGAGHAVGQRVHVGDVQHTGQRGVEQIGRVGGGGRAVGRTQRGEVQRGLENTLRLFFLHKDVAARQRVKAHAFQADVAHRGAQLDRAHGAGVQRGASAVGHQVAGALPLIGDYKLVVTNRGQALRVAEQTSGQVHGVNHRAGFGQLRDVGAFVANDEQAVGRLVVGHGGHFSGNLVGSGGGVDRQRGAAAECVVAQVQAFLWRHEGQRRVAQCGGCRRGRGVVATAASGQHERTDQRQRRQGPAQGWQKG